MGLRRFFKRVLPSRDAIHGHRHLSLLGEILHDPAIFHLTRRSAAGGVATGLFVAFFPVPGHMLIAAVAAVLLRVNLPLAVVAVWISNPITLGPQLLAAYKVGAWFVGQSSGPLHLELSMQWMGSTLADTWPALLLGCFVLGALSAGAGYAAIRLIWRLAVMRKLADRQRRRSG